MANDDKPTIPETPKISNAIAIVCAICLTGITAYSISKNVTVPLPLYAIFGAGIMGAPQVVELLRTIFRLDK